MMDDDDDDDDDDEKTKCNAKMYYLFGRGRVHHEVPRFIWSILPT